MTDQSKHDQMLALVERLKRGAPACDGCGEYPGHAVEELLDKAADALTAALHDAAADAPLEYERAISEGVTA